DHRPDAREADRARPVNGGRRLRFAPAGGAKRKRVPTLLLLLLDRLLDRLDEVGVLLVERQLGGVLVGLLALGVLEGGHALVGVVEHPPDDLEALHLGAARARLGLGRLGRLGRLLLGRFFFLLFLVVGLLVGPGFGLFLFAA